MTYQKNLEFRLSHGPTGSNSHNLWVSPALRPLLMQAGLREIVAQAGPLDDPTARPKLIAREGDQVATIRPPIPEAKIAEFGDNLINFALKFDETAKIVFNTEELKKPPKQIEAEPRYFKDTNSKPKFQDKRKSFLDAVDDAEEHFSEDDFSESAADDEPK